MKNLTIDVANLINDRQTRDYRLKPELEAFKAKANEIITKNLELEVKLQYVNAEGQDGIFAEGSLTGLLVLSCHRCLDKFEHPLKLRFKQLFTVLGGQDEKKIENSTIDMEPVLKEGLILKLPIKILCREDCKGICPSCGKELNREPCICTAKPVDARWEKLGKLKKQLGNE